MTARVCMPNFTTVCRAVSEEIGNRGFATLNYYIQGGPKKTAHYTLVHIFAKY